MSIVAKRLNRFANNSMQTTFLFAGLLFSSISSAGLITYDTPALLASTINAGLTTATTTVGGVTLTVSASGGGVLDDYTISTTPPTGLAIGAPANGNVNTDTSGNTNPSSGAYQFSFDQNISSFSLTFGFLTGRHSFPETLSAFGIDGNPLPSMALMASGLAGTTLVVNAAGDSIVANTNVGNGRGTLSYSGAPFSAFSFTHEQEPRNLGFVITSISVVTVPEPGTLALLSLGLIGLSRKIRQTP